MGSVFHSRLYTILFSEIMSYSCRLMHSEQITFLDLYNVLVVAPPIPQVHTPYYITFNDSIDIPAWLLRQKGKLIPIEYGDFLSFAQNSVVDTTNSCDILECSRQNLSYLVSQGQLAPLRENVKENLYLKKDITRLRW